jgi:hypothetical protein
VNLQIRQGQRDCQRQGGQDGTSEPLLTLSSDQDGVNFSEHLRVGEVVASRYHAKSQSGKGKRHGEYVDLHVDR